MIRLTITSYKDPEIHLFSKAIILLGSDSTQVDLALNNSLIQAVHLKIIEQSGVFFVLNLVNDPFVSVDHQPFGKKQLKSGDKIQIEQFEIQFDDLNEKLEEENAPTKTATASSKSISANEPLLQIDFPFDNDIAILTPGELKNTQLDLSLNELSSEVELEKQATNIHQPAHSKLKTSLKDDYLRDLEDDNSNFKASPFNDAEINRKPNRNVIFILCIFFLILFSFVSSLIYLSISGKNGAQELKAAQGIADIAMALTHAKLYHIKPHNQNWLDGDFIKSNLQSIIPNVESYALNLDTQGKFNCCPYTLRIYTDRDLTRFLLIAQPVSGFLNNFFPKTIIALDSELMELRTFKDVRNINRLLAHPDPLEGTNGNEIGNLVKDGQLIRLNVLAYESNHSDFSPPKNIAWIKPKAENYIYNAPRYYRLAQNLLQQAISLSTSKGSGQEVTKLKQDVTNFSKLTDLILYSDNQEAALLSRRSLMLFAPSDKFLFGYLQMHQEKFIEAHLLKEEPEEKDSKLAEFPPISEPIAMEDSPILQTQDEEEEETSIDINHPIYIQLKALVVTRQNELRPLSAAIYYLLNQELDFPKAHFQAEFQNLYHNYLITNSRHKQAIKETILKLYHQYEEMPINQFVSFINSVHLSHMIMQKDETLRLIDENCIQNLENIFKHIQKCQSILEVDNLVHIALTWLNFDYLKDPEELIKYQNLLRNHILDQLKAFLIVDRKLVRVKLDDIEILKHILDHERLINLEEKEFFLAEFDEMVHLDKKNAHLIRSAYEI